jgi:hypothetical protein
MKKLEAVIFETVALLSTGRHAVEIASQEPDLIVSSLRDLTPEKIDSLLA